MPEKLTNQLIKHMFNDLKVDLKEIKEHVQNTNGRVKNLEIWRARIVGALGMITIFLVPILISILGKYVSEITKAYFK